ncbi:hypothetical protein [Burkholderia sp. Ac-20353]|uniref:hypothetical protein n=1 Tax=Burkholderia sp. Ac-20353 TaxID=2703894 RepID=UPI00197C0FD4|nr:hypothetical protein [Burkholderia sp. Ac-20353]MBN3786769.1 hypothetical protein [Burkholderia sp. Ac-20353]
MKQYLYVAAITACVAFAACSHVDDDDVGSTTGNVPSAARPAAVSSGNAAGGSAAASGTSAEAGESASADDAAPASAASGASQ